MTLMILILYTLFFLLVVVIAVFSWLYTKETTKAQEYLGIPLPKRIRRLLHMNIVIAINTAVIIGLFMILLLIRRIQ